MAINHIGLGTAVRVSTVLAAFLVSASVHALKFTPSESEWATWGEPCQARYTVSAAGQTPKWIQRIPRSRVDYWEARIPGWYGMHHYCAAEIIFQRAQMAPSEKIRGELYERVASETNFTMQRSPVESLLYARATVLRARALAANGYRDDAYSELSSLLVNQPSFADGYVAMAMLLHERDKIEEEREVLLKGNEATEQRSATINYQLGLNYYNTGQYDHAFEVGKRAYQLGYPLPGLMNKLRSKGYEF